MKDIQKVFSNNLKRFLNYNNKTQEDLAKDLNIHRSVVSTWCRGTAFPRADKIMLLSNYFNVDFIEFFIDKDSIQLSNNEFNIIFDNLNEEYKKIIIEQINMFDKMQNSK